MSKIAKATKKPAAKVHPAVRAARRGFLPAGYVLPKAPSNYLTLQDGENRLRILSDAVVGWEAWIDGKAHRAEGEDSPFNENECDASEYGNGKRRHTHFWAVTVWNFNDKRVQLWKITQRTIQAALVDLLTNEDWGDVREYNITVKKTEKKGKTEYTLQPAPRKDLPEEAKKAVAASTLAPEQVFEEREADEEAEPVVSDDGFN